MAPLKRKSAADGLSSQHSSKRTKVDARAGGNKSRRTEEMAVKSSQTTYNTEKSTNPSPLSILVKEQPAFPRGGAGLLTPLERKQIQASANRDALAEQNGSSDLFEASMGPGPESDDDSSLPDTDEVVKSTKKKAKGKGKLSGAPASKEAALKIEGLKFKHLKVGTLILGQITRITLRDLTVALPNNLVGYVPLTAVSDHLTDHIRRLVEKNGIQQEGQDSDQDEDSNLKDYFHLGQFIRVAVTSIFEDVSKAQAKKRIELSVEPRLVNSGLSRSNLATGCTVQVSVVSVEDHGLIVDLGLEDDKVRGFVASSELDPVAVLNEIKDGAVMLCIITDIGSNGKTIKLSASQSKLGSLSKPYILTSAPTVDTFLPGTAVEVLISDLTNSGLAGKVMGLLDVTADVVHSQAHIGSTDLQDRYKMGKKIKGRLLYMSSGSDAKQLGFSVLPNILSLKPRTSKIEDGKHQFHISEIVSDAKVLRVESGLGVYLALGPGAVAFAHVSRLSDGKVDSISASNGKFKLGSKHEVRVLEYNPIDDLFIVSLQKKVLEQPFLRVEDVEIGQVVKGQISKVLIDESGIKGLIVALAEGVDGLVPKIHFSDVALQHPEKRFREGATVTARVLSRNVERRQLRLTLKKTLVNTDQKIWQDYSDITVGDSTPGTLVKVDSRGALVQFYAHIKGYLPVAEMSEAYIKDATEHFRAGQVVTVTAININPEEGRMTVSCRESSSEGTSMESTLKSLEPGTLVMGTVFEKSEDDLLLRLDGSNAIARLSIDHVSDGSLRKRQSTLGKIRVGQTLQDLVILEVHTKRRLVVLCNRTSIVKASRDGQLLKNFEDLKDGSTLTGFVTNITSDGIFVGFAAGLTGLIPKNQIPVDTKEGVDFGVARLQPISARVFQIDYRVTPPRFWLTIRQDTLSHTSEPKSARNGDSTGGALIDPVDNNIKGMDDLSVGRVIKVRVASVKATQINVELAKDVQGRIDISEIFDDLDDIKDRKTPLRHYSPKQILSVRILGLHDARNHKFLPISHRTGKTPVYELSARKNLVKDPQMRPVGIDDMQMGSSWLAYVNNVDENCLWVNISPSVRGRIRAIDVADDISLAADLETNFPVGSVLRVRVISVDVDRNRLDLSAKTGDLTKALTVQDLSKGSILTGRITKVSDRQLLVQLNDNLVGAVDLIDMEDDYSQVNPSKYQKDGLVRACVVNIDTPNKKVNLSIRPSKVLSSSMPVVDPEVTSIEQIYVNSIYRGFISHVGEKGLFVMLGHGITAFVRVTNMSDSYLKEWKDLFQRDQLVKGKIIIVDKATGHIQMSLKESVLDPNYKAPLVFTDMHVGDTVTGKVVKIETFGVFILVDSSDNVRGLCHRSEIAEQRIEDATMLFSEGDAVKAKVLKVDLSSRRINFGMKASYFADQQDDDEEAESEEEAMLTANGGVMLEGSGDEEADDLDIDNGDGDAIDDEADELATDSGAESNAHDDGSDENENEKLQPGLGFDWHVSPVSLNINPKRTSAASDNEDEGTAKRKKKRRRAAVQVDRTGDLDSSDPQSVDDFERLLLSEPDSSLLWIQYMAFYIELGDVEQARQIAERALKSIGLAQDAEKMNVWIALLNLENAYGDPEAGREDDNISDEDAKESVKDNEAKLSVLVRACIYNEPKEIYSRLASIYIQSGKHDRADELFQKMLKKFTQDPKIWTNYATFLFDTVGAAEKARALLPRALQTLPQFTHVDLTSKFALLEFWSKAGLPERGRTIFEGLLSSFPRRMDLFNVLLDLEIRAGEKAQVRALFERIFDGNRKVKPKQAKFFFKRWLAFEEEEGDERSVDAVKARAAEFVRSAAR